MLIQNLRYALRSLWSNKGFAATALLCLAFGIGLNTTIFSVVDGVLLKPLPYHDPERLLVLQARNQEQRTNEDPMSFLELRDLRQSTRAFSTVAATTGRSLTISDGGEPERYQGGGVSWDLFSMLGIAPVAGRPFAESDDVPGAPGTVLLSHAVWTVRYQSDLAVIGRTILINAVPRTVIGVMPPGFAFPQNARLWVPLTSLAGNEPRDVRSLFTFGRLAPDVSPSAAGAELLAFSRTQAQTYPATNTGWEHYTRTLRDEFIPDDVTLVIWLMMAAVTLVLFIACSNVANLQLARASSRRREIALRSALGAGRRRIIGQLLTENVVLALLSVPLGVPLAVVGTRLIANAMPADQVPYYITFAVDWRTLVYALAVAAGTAIVFGLLPALQASRGNLVESLKEGTRGNSVRRSWLRSTLVVAQVSLALVSLVSALLFVRSFVNLDSFAVGFDPSRLMTLRFYMPGEPYEPDGSKARRVQDIVERVEQLPGVEAAFASNLIPLGSGGGGGRVVIDGQPAAPGQEPFINIHAVTTHFARTLGLSVRGRDFEAAEGTQRSPVALINQTMAAEMWPNGDAIGRRFRRLTPGAEWLTVVGVLPDIQTDSIDPGEGPEPSAFVTYPHEETFNTGLVVRTVAGTGGGTPGPSPGSLAASLREAIRASDPNLPVFAVDTMDAVRQRGFWQFQLFGWIFGTIGIVGLVLAGIGVYGVLSYAVNQRTAEIGVRVALGASRRQVLGLVIGHGMALAGIGILVGLVLAALATPLAQSFLYQVSPFDPVTFVGVSLFLAAMAALASYLPALRATRVDPLVALRGE